MGLFNKTDDKKTSAKKSSPKSQKSLVDKKEKEEKKSSADSESMKDLYAGTEIKTAKKDSVKKNVNGQAYRVLIKPMLTEKSSNLTSVNQYVFMVDNTANKISIAKAVEDVYGVKPLSVNIVRMKGKKVNRGRISGRRKDFKKAIVTLKQGESISIYEGV